ncbi:MAG: pirin family protein, partial [Pseudomonadota bacterium]
GWLDSFHTFSFGSFSDPTRMGFGNLRVINEDTLLPGTGFAPHDHADMDILTLVLEGQIRHEDDQGNVATISAGEIQGMSAGQGVRHSEMNASSRDKAKFLQIWVIPDQTGGTPRYAQAAVPDTGDVLLAGPADQNPIIPIGSTTTLTLRRFQDGAALALPVNADSKRYVHLVDGLAFANGERVSAGDGLQLSPATATSLTWASDGAALVFDMPHR